MVAPIPGEPIWLIAEVRDLPTTFDDAIKKGMEIVAPSEDDLEEAESGVKTFKAHTGTEVPKATVPVTAPLAQTGTAIPAAKK